MSLPFEKKDKDFLLQIKNMQQQILVGSNGAPINSVLITSVAEGHGVTTVTANLAYALSRATDSKVLLVDGNNAGLTRETDVEKALKNPLATNLCAIKVSLEDSSKTRDEFKANFDRMRQEFSCILFDAPPVTKAPEALALVPMVDLVLLLLQANTTKWQVINKLNEKLEEANPKSLKVVINRKGHYIPNMLYRWM